MFMEIQVDSFIEVFIFQSEHEDFITAFSSIENKPIDIFCGKFLYIPWYTFV